MLKLFFIALTLFSSLSFAEEMLAADCRLFNTSGKMITTFPGKQCHFLDDGTVLSLAKTFLSRLGPDGKKLWQVDLKSFETTFTFAERNKFILVTSSRNAELPFDPRVFIFQIYDLEGNLKESINSAHLFGTDKIVNVSDFGEGNDGKLFINLFRDGVYILSPDLKKVLKKIRFEGTDNHQVKNVHMTDEGSFLYLHMPRKKPKQETPVVTLEEYFPERKKISLRYPPRPSPSFYFPYGGSLSLTDQYYVINHPLSGTYIVSRLTGEIKNYIIETHQTDLFRPPHSVRLLSRDKFFKGWKF